MVTKRLLAVKVSGDIIDRFKAKVRDEARTQSGVIEKLLTGWLDGRIKL
jgi:hypothetical protein